ncbi:DUF6148 family protein [Paenibacillus sp. GbtcB18]|uniref:DUF6148 family protein n=1 Tax=Paenibacillus sp. GbtcB18 TaxID=2824763 RepID=UPI001C30BE5B|nr:DUF6148 family protein [Paenibacillus sp. GbtcB18]
MNRLEGLIARLELYITAEAAILDGAQSYSIAGRSLTRANLSEISKMIEYLEKEIAAENAKALGGGRNKVFGVIPRDL